MVIYGSFYNLRREPFSLSPDPNFIYPSPTHREAMAQMGYAVQARKGVAVLTGEVGTGKTTLLRHLLGSVGDEVLTAYVLNPPRTRDELYAVLASEFGIDLGNRESRNLVLHRFLIDAFKAGHTVVALFDEAQHLPFEVLEEIRLLSNLETGDTKLLQLILAGQPEFDIVLDSGAMRALKQRVGLRYSLAPLTMEETVQYIAKRLKLAGADRVPFEMPACRGIHVYSRGIPRLINLLCDNCLLAGYAANQREIGLATVKSAAIDARLEPLQSARSGFRGYTLEWRRIFWLGSWLRRAVFSVVLAAAIALVAEAHPTQVHSVSEQVKSTIDSILGQPPRPFAARSVAGESHLTDLSPARGYSSGKRGNIL